MKGIPLFWGALLASGGVHVAGLVLANGILWRSAGFGAMSGGGIPLVDIEIAVMNAEDSEQTLEAAVKSFEERAQPPAVRVANSKEHSRFIEQTNKFRETPKLREHKRPLERDAAHDRSNSNSTGLNDDSSKNVAGNLGSGSMGLGGEFRLGNDENGIGAKVVYAPNPPYPTAARRAGFEGTTVLDLQINSSGEVAAVTLLLSSGREDCDKSAVTTIQNKWRFSPALSRGKPVNSRYKIAVRYVLN